jgi:hypothetical protein
LVIDTSNVGKLPAFMVGSDGVMVKSRAFGWADVAWDIRAPIKSSMKKALTRALKLKLVTIKR